MAKLTPQCLEQGLHRASCGFTRLGSCLEASPSSTLGASPSPHPHACLGCTLQPVQSLPLIPAAVLRRRLLSSEDTRVPLSLPQHTENGSCFLMTKLLDFR